MPAGRGAVGFDVESHGGEAGAEASRQKTQPSSRRPRLRSAGGSVAGATLFVTLEPCAHYGQTPPCADAVIAAGIRRVVAAIRDPAAHTAGQGFDRLRQAGIQVDVGLCGPDAEDLIAPFATLMTQRRSYVHAKWAMTLDGKLAARTGHSRWISNDSSRAIVHQLRGRMDAIVIGSKTAREDDPLLTARPPGPRVPARIVVDSQCRLPVGSQLVQTLDQGPVILATTAMADPANRDALRDCGVEVLTCSATAAGHVDLRALLEQLGLRRFTNVLVEGGSELLGSLWDENLIDELHVFVAPKLVGGQAAVAPLGGRGLDQIPAQSSLQRPVVTCLGDDVYIRGRVLARAD